jgi:hypothetical protein
MTRNFRILNSDRTVACTPLVHPAWQRRPSLLSSMFLWQTPVIHHDFIADQNDIQGELIL